MGSYLSAPITVKESEWGAGGGCEWGSSEMQGWRVSMEDAHFATTGLQCGQGAGTAYSLFGVMDGHGGREVAYFCKAHLPAEASGQLSALQKAVEDSETIDITAMNEALVRSFNNMDDMLRMPEHESEIVSFKRRSAAADQPGSPGMLTRPPEERMSGDDGGGGEEPPPGSGEDNVARHSIVDPRDHAAPSSQVSQVQNRLQSAVAADMAKARERGTLSTQEAMRIAMGMSFLQRLDGSGSSSTPVPPGGAALNVGCTAVCVAITDSHVVCANAGDSRAVLSRGGRAMPLSKDHKPNDRNERRRIEASGGMVKEITTGKRTQYRVNGDLNLSRAIGDLRHKTRQDLRHDQQAVSSTPDVHIEVREPEDEFVVLACDGVWDVRTNSQVVDFVRQGIRQGRKIPAIIEELLDACLTHDPKATGGLGADNMTCMVVKFDSFDPHALGSPRRGAAGCLPCRCLR